MGLCCWYIRSINLKCFVSFSVVAIERNLKVSDLRFSTLQHNLQYFNQRRSRDLNCETETWSKIRDRDRDFIKTSEAETRDLKICGSSLKFSKNVQKMHHHFEVETFSNFWLSSYLLLLFLTCRSIRQQTRWITEIFLSHKCTTHTARYLIYFPEGNSSHTWYSLLCIFAY